LHHIPNVRQRNWVGIKVSVGKRIFKHRWFQRSLLILGIIVVTSIYAMWRPAQRFGYREIQADEFRLVTWNVGYFAPTSNKNARDVDIARIAEILKGVSLNVAVLQELGSLEQAEVLAGMLGSDWNAHAVETGHGKQVLAVLTNLSSSVVASEDAGGRKLIGVSLRDDMERSFFIVAAHSPHPARGLPDTIANIRAAVSMIADRDEPVRIISGDLNYNFDPDQNGFGDKSLYNEVTEVMADSTATIGETYYGHTRIDHVFHFPKAMGVVRDGSGMIDLSLRFAEVPGFRDHRPIVITYDIAGVY
jgi:endonuclease/exonuclease/phosphatase family metal-dependent hydrolase